MAELSTVAQVVAAFYRLVGSKSADQMLVAHGEEVDAVVYEALTQATRLAQLFMLDNGYPGWKARSSALSWSGSDASDGGRYSALPSDFLRAYGSKKRSALVEADGVGWGQQIDADQSQAIGDYYFLDDEQLWITRGANPPTTIYLRYHHLHPAWSAAVTIDFPSRGRGLLAPYAAEIAMDDNWLPGGDEMEAKISRAVRKAEARTRKFARQSKEPRRLNRPKRVANHY